MAPDQDTSSSTTTERLEALGAMTQETENANPSHEQQAQEAQAVEAATQADIAAKQWGMLMFTVGGFACMIAPELKPVYTEERCFNWGMQVNAVGEKYGWNGPSAMPELALAASTIGFAVPTFIVVRQKIQEAKEGKGPANWLSKIGLWWRTRKARDKAMNPEPAPATEGGNGGQ